MMDGYLATFHGGPHQTDRVVHLETVPPVYEVEYQTAADLRALMDPAVHAPHEAVPVRVARYRRLSPSGGCPHYRYVYDGDA